MEARRRDFTLNDLELYFYPTLSVFITHCSLEVQRSYQVQRENTEANFQCISKNTEISILWLFSIMTEFTYTNQNYNFQLLHFLWIKLNYLKTALGGRVYYWIKWAVLQLSLTWSAAVSISLKTSTQNPILSSHHEASFLTCFWKKNHRCLSIVHLTVLLAFIRSVMFSNRLSVGTMASSLTKCPPGLALPNM